MAASQIGTNSIQRVKVYCLNDDGKWDDRGTGNVSMDYIERSEELGLYVVDEDDNATLLVHRISIDDIYRKQEDTIISWRDPVRSTELALSFQETAGCCYVWEQISNMRRNLNFNLISIGEFYDMNSESRELPDVNLSTLPQILKLVTESDITDQKRLTELMLKDNNFFQSLMNVFDICESSRNVNALHVMFNIFRGIVSFKSPQILEKLLGDKFFTKTIGCLEYNPDVHQPQHHRNHLKEHVVFKEAIPIKDALVLSKIHQIYRIGYLKDVVLTRVLDDATSAHLNSIVTANKITVLTLLKDDSTFFKELFARLRSPSTSVESRKNLVDFLHEFCSLSRSSLQISQQLRFFRELANDGIFDIIAEVLKIPDKKLVLTGTDILLLFLTHNPSLLRSYVVRPESPLLGLLVKGMMEDFGDAMDCQFIEIFRILLDSDELSERVNIMNIFCDKHLPELVDYITASCPERPDKTSDSASRRVGSHCGTKPQVLLNICELLCLCCQQDSFRKNFLHKHVTERVLLLTQRREKLVVAAVVRVFRTFLSVLDENVKRYVVKNNLMKPIIDVLVANSKRDNLLTSAILELLEHIRKNNATELIKHIVDTFWDHLASFEHLTSIQDFKTTYEQCLESKEPNVGAAPDKEKGNRVKQFSDEEKSPSASDPQKEEAKPENSNAESTISVSSSQRSGGLADEYDDDCNKPPPEEQPEASEEETEDVFRVKNKSPSRENEKEQSKRQRLCSTNEGNKKNSSGQGGEATEHENSRSSSDNSNSSDEEKGRKDGTKDDGK